MVFGETIKNVHNVNFCALYTGHFEHTLL